LANEYAAFNMSVRPAVEKEWTCGCIQASWQYWLELEIRGNQMQ
jgi:hypothetical protein